MNKAIPLLALLLLAPAAARADQIDRYVEAALRSLHIPGASLAIVRDGRIVKMRGYGRADLELDAPATPATVYEIGSNTKQFTAAAIMMLVEQGAVALDDSIVRFFPGAPEGWRRITVRHLLTHTSGIQNHVAVPGYLGAFKTDLLGGEVPGRDELLQMFYRLPLEFEPGVTWSYDNTGYYLLGIIVEKASGRSYWEFLDQRIFTPLGMTTTRSTAARPLVRHRAAGYEWVKERFENRPALPPFVAFSAGALLSTVEDMARWDGALRAGTLLTKGSRELMWTPARANDAGAAALDYGFGWFVQHGARPAVLHGGGTPGFSSVIHRYEQGLTVILLTNHADKLLDHVAIDIAGMYDARLKRPIPAVDPDPATTARLRETVAALFKGTPDLSAFTNPMRVFLGTANGKGMWQWFASNGDLQSLTFSEAETDRGDRVLRYRAIVGGSPCWFSARIAPDGRIAQMYWW